MAFARDPRDVASAMWDYMKVAESAYRHAEWESPEQMQAIQAIAAAATAAMTAEQAKY